VFRNQESNSDIISHMISRQFPCQFRFSLINSEFGTKEITKVCLKFRRLAVGRHFLRVNDGATENYALKWQ